MYLTFSQMKKSKDNMTGYAFIKFSDKEVEKALRRQKHMIDGRECTLKIPDSRANQGERGDRKVYVSYHDETLTNDEMRQHFEHTIGHRRIFDQLCLENGKPS